MTPMSCPFCGSTASVEVDKLKWWVQCDDLKKCGVTDGCLYDSPQEAIERWNRRATAPTKPAAWVRMDHLKQAQQAPFMCRVEPSYRPGLDLAPIFLEDTAPTMSEAVRDVLFEDDDEQREFWTACDDFASCNETGVDYNLLMKWANSGLLECTHFEVTAAGNAEIERLDRANAEVKS